MSRQQNADRERRAADRAERARQFYAEARGAEGQEVQEPEIEISFAQPRSRSNSLTNWNDETVSSVDSRPRRNTISSDDHLSVRDENLLVPAIENGSVGTIYRDQHANWQDRVDRHHRPTIRDTGIYVRPVNHEGSAGVTQHRVHGTQTIPNVQAPRYNPQPPGPPPMITPVWNGYTWTFPGLGAPGFQMQMPGFEWTETVEPQVPHHFNPWQNASQNISGIQTPRVVQREVRPNLDPRNPAASGIAPNNREPEPHYRQSDVRNIPEPTHIDTAPRQQVAEPLGAPRARFPPNDVNGVPAVTNFRSVNPGVFPVRESQLGPRLDPKEARELASLEYKVQKFPYLESLDPAPVNRFLAEFASYEKGLQTSIGVRNATLLRYIDFKIQNDLTRMGVDISSRDSVLMTLENLSIQDMETRRLYLVKQVKVELKWKNKGNPPASMRDFCLQADRLLDGMVLNDFYEGKFCREVASRLPSYFRIGSGKETCKARRWFTWPFMKAALVALSQTASIFTHEHDEQLKMGYNLEQNPGNPPTSTSMKSERPKKEIKGTWAAQQQQQNGGGGAAVVQQPGPSSVHNGRNSGNRQQGFGERNWNRGSYNDEQKRKDYARRNRLCYICMDPNHNARECPQNNSNSRPQENINAERSKEDVSQRPKSRPVMKQESGMEVSDRYSNQDGRNKEWSEAPEKSIFEEERSRNRGRTDAGSMFYDNDQGRKAQELDPLHGQVFGSDEDLNDFLETQRQLQIFQQERLNSIRDETRRTQERNNSFTTIEDSSKAETDLESRVDEGHIIEEVENDDHLEPEKDAKAVQKQISTVNEARDSVRKAQELDPLFGRVFESDEELDAFLEMQEELRSFQDKRARTLKSIPEPITIPEIKQVPAALLRNQGGEFGEEAPNLPVKGNSEGESTSSATRNIPRNNSCSTPPSEKPQEPQPACLRKGSDASTVKVPSRQDHEEGEDFEFEQKVFDIDIGLQEYMQIHSRFAKFRRQHFDTPNKNDIVMAAHDGTDQAQESCSEGSNSYYEIEWRSMIRDRDDSRDVEVFKGTETRGGIALSTLIDEAIESTEGPDEEEMFCTRNPLNEEIGFGENTLHDAQLKEVTDQEIVEELNKKFEALKTQKLVSHAKLDQLKELILRKREAFGISQEVCKLSKLSPLQVRLKPDAKPFTAEPRSMSSEKREALRKKLLDLQKMGMIQHEPNPFYSSPAFMVPKPSRNGEKRWRMVIDMRDLNSQVEVNGNSLPNLESQLSWLDPESCYFASMDALSGFDLLPVHPAHSTFFCISTVYGCYKLLGAPMGFINTPSIYQDRLVNEVLNGISEDGLFGKGCLQWLDDTLIYSSNWENFLQVYEKYLDRCIATGVRLNVLKCNLLEAETTWCGRRISSQGWSFSKKYFDKVLSIPQPRRLGELEDIIYGVNWLSSSIPELAELKAPFQDLMLKIKNSALDIRGTRLGRRQRSNFLLENWTPELSEAFKEFRNRLISSAKATLANYSQEKDLVLITDASHLFWSAMLCTADNSEECLAEIAPGSHEFGELQRLQIRPIFFLSGKFKAAEINWTTPEKEIYPILAALKRFDFLTTAHPKPILVLTDHLNLVYLFRPPKSVRGTSISRLGRWVLLMQQFSLKVLHVKGVQNRIADMLSRWGYGSEQETPETPLIDVQRDPGSSNIRIGEVELVNGANLKTLNELANEGSKPPEVAAPARTSRKSPDDEEWDEFLNNRVSFLFPKASHGFKEVTMDEIREAQELMIEEKPEGLIKEDNIWRTRTGKKIWVPKRLLSRIAWQNHYRMSHASVTNEVAELGILEFGVTKVELVAIVKRIHDTCLHCSHAPNMIRRQLGKLPHGTKPNEVLLSDYLMISKGQYLLTLVDDFSRKLQLTFATSANAETVAMALIKWKGTNGLQPKFMLCSDRGTHFTSKLLEEFKRFHPFDHRFSIVYSPFANGAAESINKEIVKVLQSLCSQFHIDYDQWTLLIDVVVSVLNNRRNPERANLTPLEIHSNRRIGSGSIMETESLLNELSIVPMLKDEVFLEPDDWKVTLELMAKLEEEIHTQDRKIFDMVELKRQLSRERYNAKFNIARIGFGIGDLVLISDFGTTRSKQKLKLRWTGPYIVRQVVGEHLYKVQDPVGAFKEVHAIRMRLYNGGKLPLDEVVKRVFLHNEGRFEINEFLAVGRFDDGLYLRVWWKGFNESDATWQSLQVLYEDVPKLIEKFLADRSQSDVLAQEAFDWVQNYKKDLGACIIADIEEVPRLNGPEDHLSRSSGWNQAEKEVLESCIRCFGLGRWNPILSGSFLDGKTRSQLVSAAQRGIRCQRLMPFQGLKLRFKTISEAIDKIPGPRKNGILIAEDESIAEAIDKVALELKQLPSDELEPQDIPVLEFAEISHPMLTRKDLQNRMVKLSNMAIGSKWNRSDVGARAVDGLVALKDLVKVWARKEQSWIHLEGILDSGASISVGPPSLLGDFEVSEKYPAGYWKIFDANGEAKDIIATVKLDLKLDVGARKPLVITQFPMNIVNSSTWKNLLIGNDLLAFLGVSPAATLRDHINNRRFQKSLRRRDEANIIKITHVHPELIKKEIAICGKLLRKLRANQEARVKLHHKLIPVMWKFYSYWKMSPTASFEFKEKMGDGYLKINVKKDAEFFKVEVPGFDAVNIWFPPPHSRAIQADLRKVTLTKVESRMKYTR